jgi:tetratricopeptide (TPR) repeat protein
MPRFPDTMSLFKVFLPLLVALALGVTPYPRLLQAQFHAVQQAVERGAGSAAASGLAELAQLYPWRTGLWEAAGKEALRSGELDAAVGYFEQARALEELSPEGLLLLGDAYQIANDLASAAGVWEDLLADPDPPAEVYLRLSQLQRLRGEIDAAAGTLTTYIRRHPGDAARTYELGLLLAASQPENSPAYLEQAAELDPRLMPKARSLQQSIVRALPEGEPAYTLVVAGRELANLGQWDLAVLAFEQAVRERPDYAEAWAFWGQALERLSQDGLPALEKALELDPDSLSANLILALTWQARGRPELAQIYLHHAARLAPTNPDIRLELGNNLALLGDLAAAQEYFLQAIDLSQQDARGLQRIVEYLLNYNIDVLDVALPAARQAVLIAPQDAGALDALAQVYLRLGNPLLARRFLQQALQIDPGYAPAHLHLGLAYLLLDDQVAARQHFDLVRTLAPGTASAGHAERILSGLHP